MLLGKCVKKVVLLEKSTTFLAKILNMKRVREANVMGFCKHPNTSKSKHAYDWSGISARQSYLVHISHIP